MHKSILATSTQIQNQRQAENGCNNGMVFLLVKFFLIMEGYKMKKCIFISE
jgi:hypothetical protein